MNVEEKNLTPAIAQDEKPKMKVMMKPMSELILPTDKFFDWIFDQTKLKRTNVAMCEGKIKGREIFSTVSFKFDDFFGGALQPLDKFVLLVLISERAAGNVVISIQRLYETLGGSNHLKQEMKDKLLNSVRKLSNTYVRIDMTEIVNLCYKGKKAVIEGNLIHANIVSAEINHKTTDSAIYLVGDSPIMQVAEIKSQIARLPFKYISDLSLRSTENTITLLWYLLKRVAEIVGSHSPDRKKRVHKLNTSILFETIYQKCGFTDLDKWQYQVLRENITTILEHFKKCGLIENFQFVKENMKYRSIEIFLPTQTTKKSIT